MKLEVDEGKLDRLSGRDQDLAAGLLRDLTQRAERDPLAFYFPHPKQAVFHSFDSRIRLFSGGNQSGKSTAGLADDLIQAIDREACPEHLRQYKRHDPPFLCRIMAPSFPVLETTLYQKLQELLPKDQLIGESWSVAYDKNLRVLHFKNGSKFYFQTYEMDVAKMGGATLHRVHYDEEPPQAVRNECRIRVMRYGGEEIFTQTPVEGLTWSYDELWQNRGNEVSPGIYHGEDIQVVTVDMDDNPTLSEKDKELALQGLSKEEKQARKGGKYVALHGLIYAEFGRDSHVIPELSRLPEYVNVVIGIDPGIRNPAGVLWAYFDADDSMVVFDELKLQGHTVAQVCEQIHLKNAMWKVRPIYYVIDPAARNKEHITGRSQQMEYADHGVVAIAGQNDVPAGINRVKERIETGCFFVTANCVQFTDEMLKYRWKQPPRTGEDGKQAAVKRDDHLQDACRYVCMSRPYLPEKPSEENETELQRAMREDQEGGPEIAMTEYGGII